MLCKSSGQLSGGCPGHTSTFISNVSVIPSLLGAHDASFFCQLVVCVQENDRYVVYTRS